MLHKSVKLPVANMCAYHVANELILQGKFVNWIVKLLMDKFLRMITTQAFSQERFQGSSHVSQ